MDDVVSTFPLFRLPKEAVLNTLRIMDLLQIFGISILSKKGKNLVESSKLTPRYFQISVADCLDVIVGYTQNSPLTFQLYQVMENEPIQELVTPADAQLFHEQTFVTWTNPMSVKQLLDHFHFIFHTLGASVFFYANCERFSLESIHKNIKQHIKSICLQAENPEHNRRILSLFQPASLALTEHVLVNFRVPRDILVENFDILLARDVQMEFDDFLLINSRFINFHCRTVSMRTLNKLLKLWIKGTNPRLECLTLRFRGNLQFEEVFNGLNHQKGPNGVRRFKTAGLKNLVEVADGHDIWRSDGTNATVLIGPWGDFVKFDLYVWHDHCIAI